MNTIELTDLLKGCRPVKDNEGNIIVQSIMNMDIVCLTTDSEFSLDDRFANPLTALSASNQAYGSVSFSNKERKETIVPTQMAVMTKQNAQNHGMIKAGYVGANSNVTYNDAGCVQGSQGGHFRNTSEYRFIPVTMREMVFDSRSVKGRDHSRIYSAIQNLGNETSSNAGSYLNIYFEKYDKKLEQFIAHFERPHNLIGTIVFIDGEIVAIDKFPSFTYAEQVWDLMIRDCYGSLAIISELKDRKSDKRFTKTFEDVKSRNVGEVNVLDLIEKSLKETKRFMTERVHNKLQDILDLTFETELDTEGNATTGNLPKSYFLKHADENGYIGQVIRESDYNHLVSVVKRKNFDPDALRKINELRNKARKQQRFTL